MRMRFLIPAATAVLAILGGCQMSSESSTMSSAQMDEMRAAPMNWCKMSPEPARCRARSAMEHEMCMSGDPKYYMSCRFAMDQMHGP